MQVLNKKIVILLLFIQPLFIMASSVCMTAFQDNSSKLKSAQSGDTVTVRALLEKINNDIELREYAKEFLILATQEGNIKLVDYLWTEAKMNYHYEPMLIKEALKQAILFEQLDMFTFYLSKIAVELRQNEPTLLGELLKTAVEAEKAGIVEFYLSKEMQNFMFKGIRLDSNTDSIKRGFFREAMILAIGQQKNDILNLFFKHIPSAYQYLPYSIISDMLLSKTGQTALATNRTAFEETLKILIREGVDINALNKDGDTALHALLRKSVGRAMTKEQYAHWTKKPPHKISYNYRSISILELFDRLGVDLYSRGKDGDTLAHAAAEGGNLHLIKELNDRGHALTITNNKGETVWDNIKLPKKNTVWKETLYSLYSWRLTYLEVSTRYFTEVITTGGSFPDKMLINVLSKYSLSFKEFQKWLPLWIAHGANPNVRNDKGVPVLHILMNNAFPHSRKIQHVEILFKNGADPNITDQDGNSILHALCLKIITKSEGLLTIESTMKSIEFFVENGVNPNSKNHNGETPLDIITHRLKTYKKPSHRVSHTRGIREERLHKIAEILENIKPQSDKQPAENVIETFKARFVSFFK